MPVDLHSLSLDELKKHARDVQKAIVSFEERRRKEAMKKMEEAAKEFGLTVEEVVGKVTGKAKKAASPAKYRNPANPSQTWSGRGRQPGWYKDAVAAGKKDKDLLA